MQFTISNMSLTGVREPGILHLLDEKKISAADPRTEIRSSLSRGVQMKGHWFS